MPRTISNPAAATVISTTTTEWRWRPSSEVTSESSPWVPESTRTAVRVSVADDGEMHLIGNPCGAYYDEAASAYLMVIRPSMVSLRTRDRTTVWACDPSHAPGDVAQAINCGQVDGEPFALHDRAPEDLTGGSHALRVDELPWAPGTTLAVDIAVPRMVVHPDQVEVLREIEHTEEAPRPSCADCGVPAVGTTTAGVALCDECSVDRDERLTNFTFVRDAMVSAERAAGRRSSRRASQSEERMQEIVGDYSAGRVIVGPGTVTVDGGRTVDILHASITLDENDGADLDDDDLL